MQTEKERLLKLIKGVAALLGVGVCYYLFYSLTGFGIPCVIKKVTGLQCPGCGMTRAMVALIHGDLPGAYEYNSLSITLLPLLAVYLCYRGYRYVKGTEFAFRWWEILFLTAGLVIALGYGFWRNAEKLSDWLGNLSNVADLKGNLLTYPKVIKYIVVGWFF